MKRLFLFVFILSCFSFTFCAQAQEVKTVEGEYIFHYGSDVSRRDARNYAFEQAKLNAIQNAFPGTITAESNTLTIANGTEGSFSKFMQTSESEVKGEWLGEVGEPEYTSLSYDEEHDLDGIKCRVKGKVRELTWTKPQFTWTLMRNHIEAASATAEFVSGDDIYMDFTAPCNGFLVVCCMDGASGEVNCMVPHPDEPGGVYEVKGGKRYVFFSERHDNQDHMLPTQELQPIAESPMDYMQFFVIFSPQRFTRPAATSGGFVEIDGHKYQQVPIISADVFNKWLLKQRIRDTQLQCEKKLISLRKKTQF
ncbi:MAG: hypothetical protein J6W75_06935 [Bacteroidaceae bacterium]|nr:hypothetical protein [Bacteroidaceae bacterium]